MEADEHPFANKNVRLLIGLSGAVVALFVAFFFVPPGLTRWAIVGVAAVDVVVTPWILKRAAEQAEANEAQPTR
jgi:hypothetical protein